MESLENEQENPKYDGYMEEGLNIETSVGEEMRVLDCCLTDKNINSRENALALKGGANVKECVGRVMGATLSHFGCKHQHAGDNRQNWVSAPGTERHSHR